MAKYSADRLHIVDSLGNVLVTLDGQSAAIQIGNCQVLAFDGSEARLNIGNEGKEACLTVRDGAGHSALLFDSSTATLYLGTEGNEGDLIIRDEMSRNALRFDGSSAALYVGAEGNEGDIYVCNDAGETTFRVDGNEGDLTIRYLHAGLMREVLKFDASQAVLSVGSHGMDGEVVVYDRHGLAGIRLDGSRGMLHVNGADCAEEFDLVPGVTPAPGMLLVIDSEECLKPCTRPYDQRVVGVVSASPAINLGSISKKTPTTARISVALNGKVTCRVDASYAPVEIGDLLTTSPNPGHAMKVTDRNLALGAVIGKALRPLAAGQDIIPILVALQ